ncbi:LLM class flavin-dependent oxidoreductase [Roseomonas haemaphysalidis]|uniref:LLM class flavin-dependent oxidoreductase n=1 Tax=Roseomonas haemaphysalidis TaxID=2768162 RepID=A0ABS3KJT8_9PROT|nr:LLM class flavin-dependent oxidoreductase [Roseomonas haemaphysalidis]MBO1077719.1 LLM class flavin-dependent oxidoreductase [Roseomonas haemaphysalidis]
MLPPHRQLHLGLFLLSTGHHIAGWRAADAWAGMPMDFGIYAQVAKLAEASCFDMVFLADNNCVPQTDWPAVRRTTREHILEPIALLSALAVVTQRIGLVATGSTTYSEPYHVARSFGTLDHLSRGRAGWNIVTTSNANEAWNFGRDAHLAHADRYRRAASFVDVAKGLWDSFDDDAFLKDKASGIYFDAGKLNILDHQDEHFSVRGPLNLSRPPQGYPVLVQAGGSDAGRDLAARQAEVIFSVSQTLPEAQAFYADIKARVAGQGRDAAAVKVMPGFFPVVAPSRAEAEDQMAVLQKLLHPDVGLSLLSFLTGGFDFTPYDVDGPLPELPDTDVGKARLRVIADLARRENLSIRQLYERIAVSRGHSMVVGSAEEVADHMQEWFEGGGADGFNVMPPTFPAGFEAFTNLVVPLLQRRGLFRTAYSGSTLRDHLGLPRPPREARGHVALSD